MKGFGRSVREGQIPPGAIRPAKRDPMQRPQAHAVLRPVAPRRAFGAGRLPRRAPTAGPLLASRTCPRRQLGQQWRNAGLQPGLAQTCA
jgi:hypothetical protein